MLEALQITIWKLRRRALETRHWVKITIKKNITKKITYTERSSSST